jgi:putative oxidoreductase
MGGQEAGMIALREIERRGGARRRKDLALLPPRAALAAGMLYHGVDKLKAANRQQTAQFFESTGIRPGHFWARATGITETAAGALSLLGFLTRPAALAVLVTQGVAIAKVHAPRGFSTTKGGYEYNLTLMAIAAALLVAGPGRFSAHELVERAADRRRFRRAPSLLSRLVRLVK